MSQHHWLAAIAFGLITWAGSGQAQEEAQPLQGQANTQQTQALPIPLPIDVIEDQAAAEARERREAQTRQHEIDDLAAQQGMNTATQAMNEATQRMALYAFYSICLVGLGTVLLVITLWLTRQANQAAQAAVKVTREVGEAQVRAYLSFNIEDVRIARVAGVEPPKSKVEFIGNVLNSGQTPAYGARIFCDMSVAEVHAVEGFAVDGSDFYETKASAFSIASGGSTRQLIGKRVLGNKDDIISGKLTVRLSYLIKYTDVFGEEITTHICSGSVVKRPDGGSGLAFVLSKIKKIE